jgi:hypothetical protein
MRRLSLLVLLLCLSGAVVYGQNQLKAEKEPSLQCPPGTICDYHKFDEYGDILWNEEKARLDNVAAQWKATPDTSIYIYAYNGRQGCVGEAQARAVRAREYLVKSLGIHPNRLTWKNGGYRENLTTEIWILPSNLTTPGAFPTVNPDNVRLKNCSRERLNRVKGLRAK